MVVKFYAFLFLPIGVCRLNLNRLRIFLPKSKCYNNGRVSDTLNMLV